MKISIIDIDIIIVRLKRFMKRNLNEILLLVEKLMPLLVILLNHYIFLLA